MRILGLSPYFEKCIHTKDLPLSQPAEDTDIWNYAIKNDYHILTFDSDFTAFPNTNTSNSKVIVLKSGNISTLDLSDLIISNFLKIESFLTSNSGMFILEIFKPKLI
jgi:predicted nuclease of predicted toxin-antitoxin system